MNVGGVAGVLDSLVLDIAKMTWSIAAIAPPNSVLANQGLSLVPFQRKGKVFLIAFGGHGNKGSNEVILFLSSLVFFLMKLPVSCLVFFPSLILGSHWI
jgi:hypothetical protein